LAGRLRLPEAVSSEDPVANLIENIRSLKDAGILAERTPQSSSLTFRRHNLIYGFNGSGKSTLSRLFASLQAGTRDSKLPPECAFEFALSDGTTYACPDRLLGLEHRLLVFNADFIERNLQWGTGRANPIFYIGQKQAERAAELAKLERQIAPSEQRRALAATAVKTAERDLGAFKRERARAVAGALALQGRRYEAPQFMADLEKHRSDPGSELSEQELQAQAATCHREDPLPRLSELPSMGSIGGFVLEARTISGQTPGQLALEDVRAHPTMLLWLREGFTYHTAQHLKNCLFCSGPFPASRERQLATVLDNRLERFLTDIEATTRKGQALLQSLGTLRSGLASLRFPKELRHAAEEPIELLSTVIAQCERHVQSSLSILANKKANPTETQYASELPPDAEARTIDTSLLQLIETLNARIRDNNTISDQFAEHQARAQLAVRRHYAAASSAEYLSLFECLKSAENEASDADTSLSKLAQDVQRLRSEVREHGPAAETINKLIASYLGHRELTVCAVEDGYEIHRHGRLVNGAPSEGEKTAIALCYFISTLESDGRSTKDLIVVLDDTISSLDSKALNFACALVKGRLGGTAQLFVLTHNLQCMNEFKKYWRNEYKPSDSTKEPGAMFLFMDVAMPAGRATRTARIIEMSKLLREYDSEYHFLFHHVVRFDASKDPEYEYAYMMPHVLRRVLDVFLAFRYPGSSGFTSKIEQLCTDHPELDRDRLMALDRLVQGESHSDNLDDLISFSPMTIEETRAASHALLEMMEEVDPAHLKQLRKLCA